MSLNKIENNGDNKVKEYTLSTIFRTKLNQSGGNWRIRTTSSH